MQYEITGGTLTDSVVATATSTLYGWVADWNTTTVPNGIYSLESVVSSRGAPQDSPVITITVDNVPPSTTVVLPSDGATLSGLTEYLDSTASSGVTQVQYELSGGTLSGQAIATATPTIVGWAAVWNTTTVANGSYALTSVASYAGGVSGTSGLVTLTVDNPAPSTTVVYPASGATVSTDQTQVYDATTSAGVSAVKIELIGAGGDYTLDPVRTRLDALAKRASNQEPTPRRGGATLGTYSGRLRERITRSGEIASRRAFDPQESPARALP